MTSKNITIVFGSAVERSTDSALDLGDVARRAAQRFPTATVLAAPPLYDVTQFGRLIKRLRAEKGDLLVVDRLAPRATFWLLADADIQGRLGSIPGPTDDMDSARDRQSERTIWCIDAAVYDAADRLLDTIARIVPETGDDASRQPTLIEEAARTRWYPIIDFDRCTDCLECLNFCLFGVYGLDEEDRLLVEEPDACRAACPACARVCPHHAILFPRSPDRAIAGRAEFEITSSSDKKTDNEAAAQAASERSAAVEEASNRPNDTKPDAATDPLDRLIDQIDEMDL